MIEENTENNTNESILLNNGGQTNAQNLNNFDNQPIGGSKFNFSQYPTEGQVLKPPPKRLAAKKNAKVDKKEEISKQNVIVTTMKQEDNGAKKNTALDQIPVAGNITNGFDQKPIGKTNFTISEFPDSQEPQETQTNYTMLQKIKSKAPKLRLSGMEDMLETLATQPQHEDFNQINMTNLLKQTTPANLQKILQCFKLWMEKGKNWGDDECKICIQNGFINGKTNSKKLALEIIDKMYEEKTQMVELTILTGLKNKTPKIIAGYLSIIYQLLAIYGIKRMKYLKPYYAQIVRVLGAEKLPAVKTEGTNILKEAYKWVGSEVVEPMIANLKEGLKKQIDTFWEGYDKTIIMTAPKDIPEENGNKSKSKKIDAYDLSEAVDIFKKFNEKWSESVLKAQKWNEKTKLMQQFVKAATIPKIATTDYRHINEVIRRLINDSNFNVVLWDLRMLGVMSKGLRRHFFPVVKSLFSNVLAKFRDKKTQMIEQTFNTLNDFMYSISIDDVLEDIKEGLNDKCPNMRVNLLNWIGKCVQTKFQEKGEVPQKIKESIKSLFNIFQKLLSDSVSDVRDCMAKNIGKMKMCIGEQFFFSLASKMNKNLASKISIDSGKGMQTKDSLKTNQKDQKKNEKVQAQMTKSSINSKPPTPNVPSKVAKSQIPAVQNKKQIQAEYKLECFDEPSYEDSITQLIGDGFPQEQVKNITALGAKQRGSILNIMKENPYQNFNCVLRVLKKSLKDWKEVNLLINKDFISFLEQRCQEINKPEAYVILPYIIEKIGDSKFSDLLLGIVQSMSKRIPAKYLIGHTLRYIRSTQGKKPKLNSDVCILICRLIENASISNISIKQVVEYAKQTYAVAFSKKGATQLFICLYSYIGDQLKQHLDDATYKLLENQFKNIKPLNEDQKKPRVELQYVEAVQIPQKRLNTESKLKVDITADVQRLMPKMNDNAYWQNRKEAAESLINIITENNGRVTINCMTELLGTLKNRINDPNKQLIKIFVALTGHVFSAVSQKDLKFYSKQFITTLVEGLSDKNEVNKKQIHIALNKIGQAISKQQLLTYLGQYLSTDKELRVQVLALILTNYQYLQKVDTRDYPKGIVNCLCDKNKDIRAQAEKLYEKVYEKIGSQTFRNIAKDQKPAVAKDLNIFFDKFDKNAMSSSSFASKGVSPSKIIEKPRQTLQQNHPPHISAKKRSLSKNGQKSFIDTEEDQHNTTTISNFGGRLQNLVQGDEHFAPLKVLASERVQRQQNEQLYIWKFDQIKQNQEDQLRDQIIRLFRNDISKRMLSFDHKRVIELVMQLIKICKDITYQGHIRQIYDIMLKWTFLRLWGGNPALHNIIELISPIMSILEKKQHPLNNFQVDLVLAILREYFISAYMNEYKVSESLYSIIKCLIKLSSGEKVLKKILKQFNVELSSIHRHVKKQACSFYRDGLSKLIKTQLMEYVGNEGNLEEASKIKELKNDPEFLEILSRKFQDTVLNAFGFKQQHNIPLSNSHTILNERQRDRSGDRLPPKGHQMTNTMGDLSRQTMNSNSNATKKPAQYQPANSLKPQILPHRTLEMRQEMRHTQSQKKIQSNHLDTNQQQRNFDISLYPSPSAISPLGKHLGKLIPYDQNTVNFFNTLFIQSGQKIAHELSAYAKVIFASILQSVQIMLATRKDYSPQKIVNQISLLQNCIKCPHIIKNIGELLYFGTSFALNQLVYEDENKNSIYEDLKNRNIEYKIENFIKIINSVMLRLLEFGQPQQIIHILFQLLIINSKSSQPTQKTINLIVKCIGRVSPQYIKQFKNQQIQQFFLKINQYLTIREFNKSLEQFRPLDPERLKAEDNVIMNIKSIIVEVCRIIGSDIWEQYQRAMNNAKYKDQHIASFITALNIKYPERRPKSQQKQNEELKKINQLLSKKNTFEAGIQALKRYINQHSEFNPLEYFTSLNYDQKFISMVIGHIEQGNSQRKTPMKELAREDRSSQRANPTNLESNNGGQFIKNKINQLKQKFQEGQTAENIQDSKSNIMARREEANEPRQERALEIKRRIEDMKNKMNSAVNNNRQRPI